MTFRLAPLIARKGLKLGHYVGEFVTPGIGYILKEAGAEYVFLDMEHSGNSFETINRGLRYFEAAGVPAMVRVPSDAYDHIARALDVGAEGIVVPMLGSAEQARAILDRIKYTPKGKRGLGLGLGNDRYRMGPVDEAIRAANDRTCFVALIETVGGVEEVEKIAALDGVDILWVGHADLSASMGIPGAYGHPDFKKALARVLKAGKKHGKGLGRMVTDVASGVALAKEGWDFIVYHGDAWLMQAAIREGIDGIKAGIAAKAKPKVRR
ncbi:MAG TPA: aldolase/citrate lyase family protein [Bauldia sp.]|nr:aldolase/citrate lyase family protein [Bauldia sp.]